MNSSELKDFSRMASDQLFGHILPFWCGRALDYEQGGWMSWLSNDLRPDRSQPKGLVVHSRILWTFSAVHRMQPRALFRQMADRAFAFMAEHFEDARHGGMFWRVDHDGRARDTVKKTYGQAFYIFALAEYHQAFGAESALQGAIELFELLDSHARDAVHGGYFEVCSRDWSTVLNAALSERDPSEKKSMNTHLHVLEAFTNLYRVWKDPRVAERLRELIQLFERRIVDPRTHHLHHFFDEQWSVRSDTYTFGHDIEASWLLCEAAEVLGNLPLRERVEELAVRIAEAVLKEGIGADGGLCYEGRAGRIIDPRKECWPQAEAVVGLLNAFQISGKTKYWQAAREIWEYIERHLVDHVYGEWFWRINEDGRPDPTLPKVSEWKGPYHGSRACMEAMRRVEALAASRAA